MRGLKEEGESCTDSAIQCYPLAGLAEFRREGSSGSYSTRRGRFERFFVADICRGMSLGVLCRVGLAFSRSTGPKGLPSNQSWASKIPSRYRPPQTEATRNGTGQKWAAWSSWAWGREVKSFLIERFDSQRAPGWGIGGVGEVDASEDGGMILAGRYEEGERREERERIVASRYSTQHRIYSYCRP